MTKKINTMIMCAAAAVLFACASVSFGQIKAGGYKAVSNEDAGVQEAAEFAVSDFSQKNEVSYKIVNIQNAEQQVVQGMNYRICIEIGLNDEENDDTQFVLVQVYRDLKKNFKLVSWKADACGGEE